MEHHYPHDDWKTPRQTSRGIVMMGKNILLIERWRKGLHYFSIPGGGVEPDETPQSAVVREIFEETSVKVKLGKKIYEMHDPIGHIHTIFICEYVSGEPKLQSASEEAQSMRRNGKEDTYMPRWIPLKDVKTLPFLYWAPIGRQLIRDIKNGWPDKVIILQADK